MSLKRVAGAGERTAAQRDRRIQIAALAIKSLFRYDYKVKVFSATEPSEDSDGPKKL